MNDDNVTRSALDSARERAIAGAPFEISDVATMRAAADDPHFSPTDNTSDAAIDAALTRTFGTSWRLRLAALVDGFTPRTREELAAHAALAHDDWHRLRSYYDSLPSDIPVSTREEIGRRRDAAQARFSDYSAQLERMSSHALIGDMLLNDSVLG